MKTRSAEIVRGQRRKEKYELFKVYRVPAIEDLYKRRFFELFGNRCFKCGVAERPEPKIGEPPILCMDHHVPMALGGHLVPGNIVSLCRACNNKKIDIPPEEFYSPSELEKLAPILAKQPDIFRFSFDWDAWHNNREAYLVSVGLNPEMVKEMLFNPEHRYFVGEETEQFGVSFSIDICEGDGEKR